MSEGREGLLDGDGRGEVRRWKENHVMTAATRKNNEDIKTNGHTPCFFGADDGV